MNKIKKVILGSFLLFFGGLALLIVGPYWKEQRAIAQRQAWLASTKPLYVNPNNLVGLWYGKAGPNREFAMTLTITSDTRMGAPLHSGDPAEEVERQMLSPYSMVGTLEIGGLSSDQCGYSNLSLNGNTGNNIVQMTGYRGKVGEKFSSETGLWEDTDRFQFSARLRATGMSGTFSTASNKPGCQAMTIPLDLSLIQSAAALPSSAFLPEATNPVTTAAQQTNSMANQTGVLTLPDGSQFKTAIYGMKIVGQLRATNKLPYFIVSGTTCTDCDENVSIYIVSPSDGPMKNEGAQPRFSYPGQEADYQSGHIESEDRMFFGDCLLDHPNAAVWFDRTLGNDEQWRNDVLVAEVKDDHLVISHLHGQLPQPANVQAAVRSGQCHELPGIRTNSEP